MKKRLLITSIVMMLVVAVALSTATYAWFTSNQNVSAETVSITAGTSNAPSLTIAWIPESGQPTFVTNLTGVTSDVTLMPIAPAGLSNTADSESLANQAYYSATIKTENSVQTFNNDVVEWDEDDGFTAANAARPYYLTNGTSRSIRLRNESTVINMSAVTITADVKGSAAKLVRIAVYKYDGSNYWKLVNVLGHNYTYSAVENQATADYSSTTDYYKEDTHHHYVIDEAITSKATLNAATYTVYTRDAEFSNTAATATYGAVASQAVLYGQSGVMSDFTCATSFSVGELNHEDSMDLKIVIWLDGKALDDETQGFAGTIDLKFSATAAAVNG